jgi:hypothetical protein
MAGTFYQNELDEIELVVLQFDKLKKQVEKLTNKTMATQLRDKINELGEIISLRYKVVYEKVLDEKFPGLRDPLKSKEQENGEG